MGLIKAKRSSSAGPVSGQPYCAAALGNRTRNKAKKDLPPGRSFLLCDLPGLHAGYFRRSRSTEGHNASNRGGPVPGQASGASAPGNRAKVGWNSPASQSPLHGSAMLSPLCTRGAAECLRSHTALPVASRHSHTALPRWAIEPSIKQKKTSPWGGLFCCVLCQDCTLANSGGAGAPRVATHTAGESMGVRPPDRCRAGQSNQA